MRNPESYLGLPLVVIIISLEATSGKIPFRDAFFHFSNMPHGLDRGLLPNRDMIFEFTLVPSTAEQGKMAASEVALIYDYGAGRWTPPLADREPRPAMVTAQQRRPLVTSRSTHPTSKISRTLTSPVPDSAICWRVPDSLAKLLG